MIQGSKSNADLDVMECNITRSIQSLCRLKILPDESVDFGDINVIQLLDSVFYLVFVCLDIHNEHKCVVVLNLFHGGFRCQGELDDGIVIQPTGNQNTHESKLSHSPAHPSLLIVLSYKCTK